jgi:uncharacterized protein (TIRG00374 family)
MSAKQRARQRRGAVLIGLLISLLSLGYALWVIQWSELLAALSQANYLWLIPAFLVIFAVSWVRAFRWRLLMYPADTVPLRRMYNFVNIGYLYNNILPAKAGEVIRAYLAGREIDGGIGKAFSTLLIERLLDVLCAVVIMLVLLPVAPLPGWIKLGGLVFGGVAIVAALALLILSRYGERGVTWLWRWVGRIPLVGNEKVERLVLNLVHGFGVLANWRVMPGVLLGSALIWGGYALLNYLILLAFADMDRSFVATTTGLVASAFGMVLPSSPGALGVFEAAVIEALAVFGYTRSMASVYALLLHLYTNLVLILLGLASLAFEGVRFAQLREQVAPTASLAAEPDDQHTPASGV